MHVLGEPRKQKTNTTGTVRLLCLVLQALGKTSKTLDKLFVECGTRQRGLGEQYIGKGFFAEYFLSATR